jgi:YD repeat-containing protein
MKKAILSTVIGMVSVLIGFGQAGTSPGLKVFTPASPNAAALGKYGEVPVSMYTGIPDINVPIYTVKGRQLEVPISLNYHAGGVRVEEIASMVGIGWSLNAGGVITRSIRGMPDDAVGGYFGGVTSITSLAQQYLTNLNPVNSVQEGPGNGTASDMSALESIRENVTDGEPDIFYFNFGKYSGQFFMNQQGQFVCSPLEALKIQYLASSANNNRVAQWVLTTPDGVKYVFGMSLDGTKTAFENNTTTAMWGVSTTGWYLMSIYSPQKDSITFNYSNIAYSYQSRSSEVLNQPVSGSTGLLFKDNSIGINNMSVPRLTGITAANTTVTFGAGAARTDLPGENTLGSILIKNNSTPALAIKQFQFFYDYYTNRLTLDSLIEYSGSGTLKGEKYQFFYNGSLPDPNPAGVAINSQDLWGYYNGVQNTVLPQGYVAYATPWGTITVNGADRHSDSASMLSGMLTQITYPTGGTTTFNYEPNTVYQLNGDPSIPPPGVGKDALVVFTPVTTVSDTFTILYPDPNTHIAQCTGVIHNMEQNCPFDNNGFSQCYTASLIGINGTTYGPQYFKEGTISANLPAGTYVITGQGSGLTADAADIIHFELDWTEYPSEAAPPLESVNKTIGGLRIKRVTNFDGFNTTVTKYLYNTFGDTSSSGVLVNEPYNYVNVFQSIPTTGSPAYYLQVKSFPLIPLMPTQGAPIGYANVTKLLGENGENGKEEYTFTTANNFPDEVKDYRPYPQSCSFDWRRGQLLTTTTYKNTGTAFTPVETKFNNYLSSIKQTVAYGLAVDLWIFSGSGGAPPGAAPANYFAGGYRTISEFLYLQSDSTIIYDQNNPGAAVTSVNNYTYDTVQGHYQLTSSITTNSKGQAEEVDYKYPQDLTLSGYEETARQNLVANFILTPVLETKKLRNGVQMVDTKNNYMVFGNGFALPQSVDVQNTTYPADRRIEFLRYDYYGNVIQDHKMNDVLNTFIWDYNNAYPIADILGADSVDVAYTSFETPGIGYLGNWNLGSGNRQAGGFTGSSYYTLNSNINRPGLTSTTSYIVSYWSTGGAYSIAGTVAGYPVKGKTISVGGVSWTYYEHQVTGQNTVQINGAGGIDELRLYPATAQMTTYTYSPLLGITSQCDMDNRVTYYQYDGLDRLQVVKDQDGNIIKTYQYHYKGQ